MGSLGTSRAATASDAEALKDLLSNTQAKILLPTDAGFTQSISRWSSAAEKRAGLAVIPHSAAEVSIAVKYAASQGIDLAVHGGGHSTAGASSTTGGIVLDLQSGMRDVRVDVSSRRLFVQGGCLWRDVNEEAWRHGLAVVGGAVDDTGVGGLTLGGGYGMLSPSQGLVIDRLLSATVVLASGEIVTASEDQNADLFWALRGAGPNFGVVTDFVFQAEHQGEMYAGIMLFAPTPENIEKIVSWCNEMYEIQHADDGSTSTSKEGGRMFSLLVISRPHQAGGQTMILLGHCFNGTEADGKILLQALFDLGPVLSTMGMKAYPEVNRLAPNERGLRVSQKGAAFKVPMRVEFFNSILDDFNTFMDANPDACKSSIFWEFFNPAAVVRSEKGCFANRGWVLNGLIMPQWTRAENDGLCRQFARNLSGHFKSELARTGEIVGKGVDGGAAVRGAKKAVMLYGNYDQYDEKSRDIFGDHYPRLQELKARYDPGNVFNKLFPIQPVASV